jgi:hypothetical protein
MDFKTRMSQHKHCCNNENGNEFNRHIYKFIRENGGWKNWNMNIIDSLTTTDEYEMIKCERKYIEEQQVRLNKDIPSRTRKEYRLDNLEKINKYQKQYREANKEKKAEYLKQYHQDHKEEISKKKLEKIQCERCGAFSARACLRRHQRTKKCINNTTTTTK